MYWRTKPGLSRGLGTAYLAGLASILTGVRGTAPGR